MSNFQRVNFNISKDLHSFFKGRSEKTGIPMSALMVLALENHVREQTLIPQVSELLAQARELKKGE